MMGIGDKLIYVILDRSNTQLPRYTSRNLLDNFTHSAKRCP